MGRLKYYHCVETAGYAVNEPHGATDEDVKIYEQVEEMWASTKCAYAPATQGPMQSQLRAY